MLFWKQQFSQNAVEVFMEDADDTFFRYGSTLLEYHRTQRIDVKGNFIEKATEYLLVSLTPSDCLVGWGCRILRLPLCRDKIPTNEYPGYNTKQSDGGVPVILELWGM